jgi:RNA polymerase sigma-70 factor (ECF subfamily)
MREGQHAHLGTALGTAKDPQLVELARQGDQEAFGELIRRHRQRCVDLARFFLRNPGDAEDQAQDAFLKAYEHLEQFHGDAEFFTWLARIVTNQCLMLMRLRRRARFSCIDEIPSGPDVIPIQLAASGPDPEGEMAFRELTAALRFEVQHIPRLLRSVMLLHDIQGLPMMDVAAQLGITVAAAKSRLGRARLELRQRMARHYEGIRNSSPLSRSAAPLNRVGRHCVMRAA